MYIKYFDAFETVIYIYSGVQSVIIIRVYNITLIVSCITPT